MAKAQTTQPGVEEKTNLNVYQKLQAARIEFLNNGVKKSGVNLNLEFQYFELEDIVPPATRIFNDLGLISLVTFTNDEATMRIVDTDKPEDEIVFTSPMREIESRISKAGNRITDAMQSLGMTQTYARRYLYFIALDVVENDGLDAGAGAEDAPETPKIPTPKKERKSKAPVAAEKREQIKNEVVASDEQAVPLQVDALKKSLKVLRELDPTMDDFVQEIALKTEAFTVITKKQCEVLILKVGEMIDAYEQGDNAGGK